MEDNPRHAGGDGGPRTHGDGHACVVYDVDPEPVGRLAGEGAVGAASLDEFVSKLAKPRTAWLMLPAAVTGDMVDELSSRLEAGDIIIDGGNTYYRDDIHRGTALAEKGIHYVDCGTSGGIWGLDRGFCLMIGGDEGVVFHLDPIFRSLAPGHFVKMVHNGIEYGLMAAYAEGLNILKNAGAGTKEREADAETTPLRDPEYYRYDIDVAEVAEVWRRGSVVASWLLDLTAAAFASDPELSGFAGRVADSGEGRWTVQAAVDEGVPAHVISAALYERFGSRGNADFAARVLSAMRKEFGGHPEKREG